MSLSAKKTKAAQFLAEDLLSDEQIASKCKIERRTLARWKLDVSFAQEVSRLRGKAAEGAAQATEKTGFVTTERLIQLANLAPKDTNGTIGGQVKACLGIAQIRGEIVQKHEDVTQVSAADRKKRVIGMLREGARRVEKVQ